MCGVVVRAQPAAEPSAALRERLARSGSAQSLAQAAAEAAEAAPEHTVRLPLSLLSLSLSHHHRLCLLSQER